MDDGSHALTPVAIDEPSTAKGLLGSPPSTPSALSSGPSAAGTSVVGVASAPPPYAAFLAAAFFVVVVLRLGWVSDDAFIAIRSVDHLVHGVGFTVNIGERVQSFTSPLMALLCVPLFALTRNPYSSLILANLLCSVALAWAIVRQHRARPLAGALVLLGLAASYGFSSFSTSGLENPLSHLLLALFIGHVLAHPGLATRELFLLAGALFLTRFDEALFTLPVLAHVSFLHRKPPSRRALLKAMLPGAALVTAWLAFATFYYGFPFPNTAYAKLNTAIPLGDRAAQGFAYLIDAVSRDAVVAVVLIVGGLVASRARLATPRRLLFLGVALYLVYVISIGGDFMSGRFLTSIYLATLMLIVEPLGESHRATHAVGAGLLALLVAFTFTDRRAERTTNECFVPRSGIVDERECYIENTGLVANVRNEKWRAHGYLRDFENAVGNSPDHVVVFDLAGLVSYANRQERHIVERFALTEPLLARIKLAPSSNWRIGHFFRELPPGYLETLRTGNNVIENPCIHRLYERLSPVIHGPLLSASRFANIVSLNLGSATCPAP